jgi:predicted DNA-binding transcriptional regulator YafY
MIRRSFFQTLAAALLPRPILATAKTVQPGCEPFARTLHHPPPVLDPEWVRTWREISKIEVFAHDLECHDDPHQVALAEIVMRHISGNIPISFRYVGGSEPGAIRTVLPTLLFYQDYFTYYQFCEDPTEYPEFNESPLYLLGWCQTRQAARTFRLDRMVLLKADRA